MNRPPLAVEISRPTLSPPDRVPKIAVVVERDPGLRDTLTEYLLSQSLQVLALSTTPHPDDVRRLRPDLLVLDLLCDGAPIPVETLRQLRASLTNSSFVALSADPHLISEYIDEIDRLVSGVLIKPFDLDHFDHAAGLSSA